MKVVEVAEKISSKVKTGILSNHSLEWFSWHLDQFRHAFKEESLVIPSYQVNCYKPQREIYELLISRVRECVGQEIEPSQIVFFDDKQVNVDKAKECGLNGFCFDRRKDSLQKMIEFLKKEGIDF